MFRWCPALVSVKGTIQYCSQRIEMSEGSPHHLFLPPPPPLLPLPIATHTHPCSTMANGWVRVDVPNLCLYDDDSKWMNPTHVFNELTIEGGGQIEYWTSLPQGKAIKPRSASWNAISSSLMTFLINNILGMTDVVALQPNQQEAKKLLMHPSFFLPVWLVQGLHVLVHTTPPPRVHSNAPLCLYF